jgi:periplasmic protein CpxP/Spy
MLLVKFRARRLAMVAGLAAAWWLAAGAPSGAAATIRGPAPGPRPLTVLPIQAPAPNVEANIAQLHQRLQITPAQEPRFAALANVMRANARMAPAGAPPANPNAVEGLQFAIEASEQELGGLKRLLPALEALYASLSPAQQQTADQVFRQGPGE